MWYQYLPTPPLGQDITQGQLFKRNLTGLNSEFSFSETSCLTKAKEQKYHHHHHHHVVLVARISLTLSRYSSLSFIAPGRSSGQHPVSSHSCWMYVRAGRPAFARPCVGVHKSTSLMSSSLLLQQCTACLVRLTCLNFGGSNNMSPYRFNPKSSHTKDSDTWWLLA